MLFLRSVLLGLSITAIAMGGAYAECVSVHAFETTLSKVPLPTPLVEHRPRLQGASAGASLPMVSGFDLVFPKSEIGEFNRLFSPMGWAETTCGIRLTWQPRWDDRF